MLASIVSAGMVFTACSDNLIEDDSLSIPSEQVVKLKNEVKLVDESGNEVSDVSGKMGKYYLDIKTSGEWSVNSSDTYIVPSATFGKGCARVPVIVGLNWQGARSGALSVSLEDDGYSRTRASVGPTIQLPISQAQMYSLSDIKKRIGSNLGAGYTYTPTTQFVLGTNIEVFNIAYLDTLQSINGSAYIKDDLYPRVEEQVHKGSSETEVKKSVSVGVSVGIDFTKVSGSLDVDVNTSKDEKKEKTYAIKRMKSYQFTREIDYLNILADSAKSEKLISSGFKMVRDRFVKDIHTIAKSYLNNQSGKVYTGTAVDYKKLDTSGLADINEVCEMFVDNYGPTFISKAVMGCVLDYQMEVSNSFLNDTVTVDVVLKGKFESAVKPENTDSMANTADSLKNKPVDPDKNTADNEAKTDTNKVSGEVDVKVKNMTNEAVKNSSAYVTVSGGDVSKVSILTTGGELMNTQLIEWQQSVEPNKAVMIDYRLVPISALITDSFAQKCLYEYLKTKGKVIGEENSQVDVDKKNQTQNP